MRRGGGFDKRAPVFRLHSLFFIFSFSHSTIDSKHSLHLRTMTPSQTPILAETPFPEWARDIERARIANGIPGMSVAVVHKGKIIFAQGFGRRNENNDPFTAEVWACSACQQQTFALVFTIAFRYLLSSRT